MTENDSYGNESALPLLISDPERLARYGVLKMPIVKVFPGISMTEWRGWANVWSQVSPEIMAMEGDGDYVFYRNILDEPDLPINTLANSINSEVLSYFGLRSNEIRLDDAFCIHYHTSQKDTSGARHTDPSDITINLCLEKSSDTTGSNVLFHGTKQLGGVSSHDGVVPKQFLVEQEEGFATIHWGSHPHETTPLLSGRRTNVVLTYCYTDPQKSDVLSRTCYA